MELSYTLVRSSRKTVAIQIKPDGELIVRAPARMSKAAIEAFVRSKQTWIEKHWKKQPELQKLTEVQLQELTRHAREVLPQIGEYYAPQVGVSYGTVTIRHQHTRWGSCSGKGNLNFNCLLMLMPDDVIDYVVVHELCHRKEMNHSAAFWAEVERILPDYRKSKQWLRENGPALISRLP